MVIQIIYSPAALRYFPVFPDIFIRKIIFVSRSRDSFSSRNRENNFEVARGRVRIRECAPIFISRRRFKWNENLNWIRWNIAKEMIFFCDISFLGLRPSFLSSELPFIPLSPPTLCDFTPFTFHLPLFLRFRYFFNPVFRNFRSLDFSTFAVQLL